MFEEMIFKLSTLVVMYLVRKSKGENKVVENLICCCSSSLIGRLSRKSIDIIPKGYVVVFGCSVASTLLFGGFFFKYLHR